MGRLRVVSLFAGCGGTDLGFKGGFTFNNNYFPENDIDIVYANDFDKNAADIFDSNFPVKTDRRSIKEIQPEEIPNCDVITGGFPCQSFSIVAQNPKRLGYKDEKGKLFFDMSRIIREKKPLAFIAENVKGILSANKSQAFPLIINEFENSGYIVNYSLLNAVNYCVPQKRERVFIVGLRNDLSTDYTFPSPVLDESNFVPLSCALEKDDNIPDKYIFSDKAIDGLKKSNPIMNKGRVQDINKPCNTVGSHLAKVSLNSTDPVLIYKDRYRRFTPREVARIQSFPEEFKLVGTDTAIYRALGNAIPPVLFWHIARELVVSLNKI